MDAHETDAKLREIFELNAPPAQEAHLAAALPPDRAGTTQPDQVRAVRPDRTGAAGGGARRVPKRPPRWRPARTALVGAGALVLAAVAAIGIWQAVERLSGDQRVIMITNQTTTTTGPGDLQAQITDGPWELRADRQRGSADTTQTFGLLPESSYQPIANGPTFNVVFSEGGTKVSVTANLEEGSFTAQGKRTSTDEGRLWYEMDSFAGGRFVIWGTATGLEAEETTYGSGVPIIHSFRGKLVESARQDPADDQGGGAWTPTDSIANGLTAAGMPVKTQIVFGLPEYKAEVGDFGYATARSTLIARVTALLGASEIHDGAPSEVGGVPSAGHVLRPVRIEQVYKGDGVHNTGAVVAIKEYWTSTPSVADPAVTIISSIGFYLPMKVGEQYILLLSLDHAGDTQLASGEFRKFVYNDQTKTGDPQHLMSDEVWEVGGPNVLPAYFTLAKQVMGAYGR